MRKLKALAEVELIKAIRTNSYSGLVGLVDQARTVIKELTTPPDCPEAAVSLSFLFACFLLRKFDVIL
jgi:hypothetical protein